MSVKPAQQAGPPGAQRSCGPAEVEGVSPDLGRATVLFGCRGSEGWIRGCPVPRGGRVGASLSPSAPWVKPPRRRGFPPELCGVAKAACCGS